MSLHTLTTPARYYHIHIHDVFSERFFHSNTERALIISALQKYLGTRSLLQFPFHEPALAKHIDLLAYSLHENGIELVVFAISKESVTLLTKQLIAELKEFRFEYTDHSVASSITHAIKTLRGIHHALEITRYVHLLHNDWENDRYSSIGFYLHDRRGDWMRLWRVTRLYDNEPSQYRRYLLSIVNSKPLTTGRESLKHA